MPALRAGGARDLKSSDTMFVQASCSLHTKLRVECI